MGQGGPGPVYVGSRVRIVWVGQGGTGPVHVESRVRIVWVGQGGWSGASICWV